MIGLAPSHQILQQNKTIDSINFQSNKKDLSKNIVHGAKKKGGARLRPETPISQINCSDGSYYIIKSCVNGSLLEVNSRIKDNPNLITKMPSTQGYIAIIKPDINDKNTTTHLLTREQYLEKRFNQ